MKMPQATVLDRLFVAYGQDEKRRDRDSTIRKRSRHIRNPKSTKIEAHQPNRVVSATRVASTVTGWLPPKMDVTIPLAARRRGCHLTSRSRKSFISTFRLRADRQIVPAD